MSVKGKTGKEKRSKSWNKPTRLKTLKAVVCWHYGGLSKLKSTVAGLGIYGLCAGRYRHVLLRIRKHWSLSVRAF